MKKPIWCVSILLLMLCGARPLYAQLPFYTDDPSVTAPRVFHFEFFNEIDALQSSQYPNLRQNTANFKINYGLPHSLELDFDFPYLSIDRASGSASSAGIGDVDMGVKWNFHKASPDSWVPTLGSSLYIEFPTGDERKELGSGLADYWLNTIAQKPFTDRTRMNVNLGFLFAGNTSTGAVGVQTTRGHVFTGGLSVLHDFTHRLTLGIEAYGGVADTSGLGRRQLQGLLGGEWQLRNGMSLTFGLIGGTYEASPRIGGQLGFTMDLPAVFRHADSEARSLGNSNADPAQLVPPTPSSQFRTFDRVR